MTVRQRASCSGLHMPSEHAANLPGREHRGQISVLLMLSTCAPPLPLAPAGRKSPWAEVYDPARPPPVKSLMEARIPLRLLLAVCTSRAARRLSVWLCSWDCDAAHSAMLPSPSFLPCGSAGPRRARHCLLLCFPAVLFTIASLTLPRPLTLCTIAAG